MVVPPSSQLFTWAQKLVWVVSEVGLKWEYIVIQHWKWIGQSQFPDGFHIWHVFSEDLGNHEAVWKDDCLSSWGFVHFNAYSFEVRYITCVHVPTANYGHTHQKAPDPVWSPKLSWWWRSQYCGGGPHGNTACCSFFLFSHIKMTSHLMFCLFMVHLNKETLLAFCVECLFEGLNWNTVGFFFFFLDKSMLVQ